MNLEKDNDFQNYLKYKFKYLNARSKLSSNDSSLESSPDLVPPVDFINQSDKSLEATFLSSLTQSNNDNLKMIAEIIQQEKQMQTTFSKATIDDTDVFMVMVSCHLDSILIKYGKEFNFPRGFPVIWVPSQNRIQTFGFYPKFDNDAKKQNPENDASFANIKELNFFVKWSGFLGQLCPFQLNGKNYWTATSKNSANSTMTLGKDGQPQHNFVQDAKRIWQPFIKVNVLDFLVQNQLHVCAEMLSKLDQTHGACVYKEGPLVTAVGRGIINTSESTPVVLSFTPPKVFDDSVANTAYQVKKSSSVPFTAVFNLPNVDKAFYVQTNTPGSDPEYYFVQKTKSNSIMRFKSGEWVPEAEQINFTTDQMYFIQGSNQLNTEVVKAFGIQRRISYVDFLPLNQTVQFCQRVQFLCGNSYQYQDNNAKILMSNMSNNRDTMDYATFLKIVSSVGGNNIMGTTNHQQHLGNILEGLVIHITNNDGSNLTKKYKFPYYTLRTMCIRSLLNPRNPVDLCSLDALDTRQFGYKDFCRRWCVSHMGRQHIFRFLLECSLLYKLKTPLDNQDPAVKLHIRLADHVMHHGIRQDVETQFLTHAAIKKLPTTIILDPWASKGEVQQLTQQLKQQGYDGFTVVDKASKNQFDKLVIIQRSDELMTSRVKHQKQLQQIPFWIQKMMKNHSEEDRIETTITELTTELNSMINSAAPADKSVLEFKEEPQGCLFVLATGIQGIGKSYWTARVTEILNAQGLTTVNLAQDDIFAKFKKEWMQKNKGKTFIPNRSFNKLVSQQTRKAFQDLFQAKTPVVISSRNNFTPMDRKYYVNKAKELGYRVISIDPAEKKSPKEWAKLYLVSQQAVHQRRGEHPTLNYFEDQPEKLASIVQSFAGEYRYPSSNEVTHSYKVAYLKPGSYAGFDSFDLDAEATHLKQAGFKRQTLSTGMKSKLSGQPNFPEELATNRNQTMVAQIVEIIKTEYLLSQDYDAAQQFSAAKAAPLKTNFDKSNIVMSKLVNLSVPMFRYTHLKGGPRTFTPEEAKQSPYITDPKRVMYVAYVVEPEAYKALHAQFVKLFPEIPLQTHFHMTLGFYKKPFPKINLEALPPQLNCTISQILKTKDNGLAVAEVKLSQSDETTLSALGVQFIYQNRDKKVLPKHLHFTLGTKLNYRPFHSNAVLESWYKA